MAFPCKRFVLALAACTPGESDHLRQDSNEFGKQKKQYMNNMFNIYVQYMFYIYMYMYSDIQVSPNWGLAIYDALMAKFEFSQPWLTENGIVYVNRLENGSNHLGLQQTHTWYFQILKPCSLAVWSLPIPISVSLGIIILISGMKMREHS